MENPRDLRRRIRSISNTLQITKAMQMVAASKMRRAQQATLNTRPFGQMLYRIQRRATARAPDFTHPLLEVREVRKQAVILIGTDQGLCGALNSNVFRLVAQFDARSTVFITAGRKAAQFIGGTQRKLVAEFTYADIPHFSEARAIAAFARDLFLKGEVDQVQVAGTHFINTLTQQASLWEFLPIGEIKEFEAQNIRGAESKEELAADTNEYVFEPSPEAVLSYLFGHYLNIYIHLVLLEAKASEQSARMVAMKNASENAEGLIRHLTLEYNTIRQGNITQEMLEIAGGQAG
jgi:F-type H+-transporting ATPase subunit gamma